jgi:hypothetical protein
MIFNSRLTEREVLAAAVALATTESPATVK